MSRVCNPPAVRGPFSHDVLRNPRWRYPLKPGAPDPLHVSDLKDWNDRSRPASPVFEPIPLAEQAIWPSASPRLRPRELDRFLAGIRRREATAEASWDFSPSGHCSSSSASG